MRRLLPLVLAACSAAPRPAAPVAPAPAPTVVAEPTPPTLRLPDTVKLREARLHLWIDAESPDFRGEARYAIDVVAPTSAIWLHALGLGISRAAVGDLAARAIVRDDGFLGLAFPRELPAGPHELVITFSGRLDEVRSQGLYRVKEPDGHFYAYTFFEPVDARRAFPCFDEPSFKVPWTVSITAPKGQIAVGNAPTVKESPDGEGVRFDFAPTPPLPSYLVAFVVGPFEIVDGGTAGAKKTPIRFVLPQGRPGELGYAKKVTPKVVEELERFFRIPYPFAKLDVAVVPRFWGTMEHPGLVAMGQPLTLIKPEDESLGRQQWYANILVHELAHYWFGDLVTMAWWDETWLNEGLTTWADRWITAAVEPAWKFERERFRRREAAMNADAVGAACAMRKPIRTLTDIGESFDNGTTYYKGDALMGMLDHWLGHDVVARGIKAYLEARAWKNATTPDFLAAMSAAAGRDLAPVLSGFIDQPGVPEVSVRLRCAGDVATVSLAQRRYVRLGAPPPAETRWSIPVCLRTDRGEHCGLLDEASAEWTLPQKGCPAWLHGNADAAGYYRVDLDAAGRKALAAAAGKLTPGERQAFLQDVDAQLLAGQVEIGEALALGARFAGEDDPLVLGAAIDLLDEIGARSLPDELWPAYRKRWGQLFGARAAELGLTNRPTDGAEVRERRDRIVGSALYAEAVPALDRQARRLAERWLEDRRAIDEDARERVLAAAARGGDAALFDAFLAEARATADREDRALLLGLLGEFRDPALVKRALELLLDPTLDIRDSRRVFYAAMRNRFNRAAAHAFVLAHWDEILPRLRDDERSGIVGMLAGPCDAALREIAARELPARAAGIDGGPAELAKGLERSAACLALREKNAPGVAAWLRR